MNEESSTIHVRHQDIVGVSLASQVLVLARQLRADDIDRGKTAKVDYESKAVQIIRNAREAIIFRWNYELPGQDQI